jgi:GNAT superfamily N-acetyltransferase
MNIQVQEAPIASVGELGQVPIAFTVDQRCEVSVSENDGRFILSEHAIKAPYVKDYDGITGEGPAQWARRFDVSKWGFIRAQSNGRLVGGAAIAFASADVMMLERRQDLAVLWDIRVAPDVRRQGVGFALFQAAEAWAVSRNCRQLKIETQNINVVACRFYARQGCVLRTVNPFAYSQLPDEVQLLWYKDIAPQTGAQQLDEQPER